jgi:XTP/dITP diphosphohydrolase
MKIVFATNNENKIFEVSKLIPKNINLISLQDIGCFDDVPETSNTLEGNSFQKANYIFQKHKQNCLADDTGLEIESLNGEPGVFSARYAGEPSDSTKNIVKVLQNLKEHRNRTARFRTVFTVIINGSVHQFEGIVNGTIISELRGSSGFGYDPIFVPDGFQETFAELSIEIKNQISHRGLATKKLIEFLSNY